jgi:hypothetical protein
MEKIVFTLCSNNYLAHAKTLGDSLLRHEPGIRFIIGLVDKRDPAIDYNFFSPFEIVAYDEIGCALFEDMLRRYNIIEFNTAVKPFYLQYFFEKYAGIDKLYYIDPDIFFYENMAELDGLLDEHNMVLTPHLTVAPTETTTDELVAMRHGHYNLGFIALKRCDETMQFIHWWQQRLKYHCVIDKPRGLFVDQKWVNLAPLYFDGMFNFKHQGYNMAWWNMGERVLLKENGKYFVNNSSQPLVFFHFSGFKPGSSTYFGRTDASEYSFETRKDIKDIFEDYASVLLANKYEHLWKQKPLLPFGHGIAQPGNSVKSRIKKVLRSFR